MACLPPCLLRIFLLSLALLGFSAGQGFAASLEEALEKKVPGLSDWIRDPASKSLLDFDPSEVESDPLAPPLSTWLWHQDMVAAVQEALPALAGTYPRAQAWLEGLQAAQLEAKTEARRTRLQGPSPRHSLGPASFLRAQFAYDLASVPEALQARTAPDPSPPPEEADLGAFRRLAEEELRFKIRRHLLDADLDVGGKFLSLDILPGVNLSARYKWKVQGEPQKKSWTRVDTWRLRTKVGIGDWLKDGIGLPFKIQVDHERSIVHSRSFSDAKKAWTTPPTMPLRIPLTAAKAREMPVGHFWSLPVILQGVVGMAAQYAPTLVGAKGFAQYVVRGHFRLNLFKEDSQRVRLQLIGAQGRGVEFGGQARIEPRIFGIGWADSAVHGALDAKLLEYRREHSQGVGMAVDYAYDLDNPEAALAFERMTQVSLGMEVKLATHPKLRAEELENLWLTDFRPSETLWIEDQGKPPAAQRVRRRFLGTNQFRLRESKVKIGPRLARYGRDRRWVENEIKVVGPQATKRYRFPMFHLWKGWQLLFGVSKESTEFQAYSLMELPARSSRPRGPQGLILTERSEDRRQSKREFRRFRDRLEDRLGPDLSQRIGLSGLPEPTKTEPHFAARWTLALHPKALRKILAMDPVEMRERAKASVESYFEADNHHGPKRWWRSRRGAEAMVSDLFEVRELGTEAGGPEQIEAVLKLFGSELWRELGIRFLLDLLGGAPSSDEVFLEFSLQRGFEEPFYRRLGENRHSELLRVASAALGAVSDRIRIED